MNNVFNNYMYIKWLYDKSSWTVGRLLQTRRPAALKALPPKLDKQVNES